jgi:hypothetical protein
MHPEERTSTLHGNQRSIWRGCPLAFAAGVDAPEWFVALAAGLPISPPPIGEYERDLYLSRSDDSVLLRTSDLEDTQSTRL